MTSHQTHYIGDGCQPEHVWPAPTKPPDKIRHSWKCSRHGVIVETMRPDPARMMRVVSQCQNCGADDMPSRIECGRPDPPDAA